MLRSKANVSLMLFHREKKTASHGNRGWLGYRSSCHEQLHPHWLPLFLLSLHITRIGLFLNGQIWQCPIRPMRGSANPYTVSTSTRTHSGLWMNNCSVVMWHLPQKISECDNKTQTLTLCYHKRNTYGYEIRIAGCQVNRIWKCIPWMQSLEMGKHNSSPL